MKNFEEKKEYRLDIPLYNNVTINAFEFKFSRWEALRNLRALLCFKIDWTCSLFLLLLHLLFMFLKFALHGGKLPPKFMWNTKRRQWRVIHSYSEWCYWNVSIPIKIVKSHYIIYHPKSIMFLLWMFFLNHIFVHIFVFWNEGAVL